jgi:hypothetical protein
MVEAGMVRCARCGDFIEPGTPRDLGHVDGTNHQVYPDRSIGAVTARRPDTGSSAERAVLAQMVTWRRTRRMQERLRKGGGGLR